MTEAELAQRRRNVHAIAARRRQLTRCKRGHEFTPENTWIRGDGRRQCRTCNCDRVWYFRRGLRMVA